MRLSFHVQGDAVVNTLEAGTLSFKRSVALETSRIHELSLEALSVLERGNRAHTLSDSNLRHLREVGEQLTHLLTHPEILERLPSGDEAIVLSLDESLVTVPWELLHDGEDFFCHRYDLGRLVATPQAMIGRSAPMPSSGPLKMLVICADPQGDLPQVQAEGEALLTRLDARRVVDANLIADPTVENVRRQLKDYDIIHFAGHAEHDAAHPERSGWLLADGKLTAADVMALSGGRSMPMLVFSNACRSSETEAWRPEDHADGHKVYGLANAFLLAGVRLYVGTQWEVVDGHSADLALAFYEALGRGAGAGMAMRVARKKIVREQGETTLCWASYVLYGDPSLVPMRPTEFRQKDLLSASLLDARLAIPAKRPISTNGVGRDEREITGPQLAVKPDRGAAAVSQGPRSLSGLIALISAVIALAAVGTVIYLLREQSRPKPNLSDKAGVGLPRLENGKQLPVNPLVALMAAPDKSLLGSCLRGELERSPRFRLVSTAGVAEQGALPKTRQAALRAGQALRAEVVVYADGKDGVKPRLAAVDVLTGDVPIIVTINATRTGCGPFIREMSRVLLGEGQVLSLEGGKVIVDLGWRSRVAPGTVLLLERSGRPAGSLTVEKVEMDRSVARGKAQVGDRVRLPR
ncbi:MAG: hypothetical protein CSB49_03525 [Proteobacteria bacterium]|nr:MAG: hypothetical protein CSB49_03525 [Pseudomonadota bacterium]